MENNIMNNFNNQKMIKIINEVEEKIEDCDAFVSWVQAHANCIIDKERIIYCLGYLSNRQVDEFVIKVVAYPFIKMLCKKEQTEIKNDFLFAQEYGINNNKNNKNNKQIEIVDEELIHAIIDSRRNRILITSDGTTHYNYVSYEELVHPIIAKKLKDNGII